MCAETELLLMVASRAQLVREKILPALEAGLVVLCDRYADASVAYQGFGRGLGDKLVDALQRVATGGLEPDLTFLCLLPPAEGQARLEAAHDRPPGPRGCSIFTNAFTRAIWPSPGPGEPRLVVLDAPAVAETMLEAASVIWRGWNTDCLSFCDPATHRSGPAGARTAPRQQARTDHEAILASS